MANFKVGQRVRITVASRSDPVHRHAGRVGTITEIYTHTSQHFARLYGDHHRVRVDELPCHENPAGWAVPVSFLAPLTDPLADQFIGRIKKLAREPQPVAPVFHTEGN